MPTMHVTPFSVGASRAQCLPDSKAGLAAAQPRFPQEPQDLPTEPKPFCPPFIFTAPSQPQDKGCPCKDTAMAQTHTEGTSVHGSIGDKHLTSTQGPVWAPTLCTPGRDCKVTSILHLERCEVPAHSRFRWAQLGTNVLEHLWGFCGALGHGIVHPEQPEALHGINESTETCVGFVLQIPWSWHRLEVDWWTRAAMLTLRAPMGFCPSCQLCKMVSTSFKAIWLILLGLFLCKVCSLHCSTYWKCMMLLTRRKRFWWEFSFDVNVNWQFCLPLLLLLTNFLGFFLLFFLI